MLLAETVQLDGGTVAFLMAIFVLFLFVCAAVVVAGFMAARRAGATGSPTATGVWASAAMVELFAAWVCASTGVPEYAAFALVMLGGQVVVFAMERAARRTDD